MKQKTTIIGLSIVIGILSMVVLSMFITINSFLSDIDDTNIITCQEDLLYCQSKCISIETVNEIVNITNSLIDSYNICYNQEVKYMDYWEE